MKKKTLVLGIFVLGLVLNLSTLFADTLLTTPVSIPSGDFIQCTVANTTKSPVTVKISIVDSVTGVIAGPYSVTLQAQQIYAPITKFALGATYSCKFSTDTGSQIRGGLTAFTGVNPYLVVPAN